MRATRFGVVGALCVSIAISSAANCLAAVPSIVTWALRTTVDSDGDGAADLSDNAPGAFDVSQTDTDADGIGDIIDPTPVNSNPSLGDPGLVLGAPDTIAIGGNASIDYLMALGEPPGQWGHIDLDLGGNGVYDATYFGPLTFSLNQIVIPAALYSDPTWNLNAVGSYLLHAKAYGPGRSSEFVSISGVNVVPEPATCGLVVVVGLVAARWRRRPPLVAKG